MLSGLPANRRNWLLAILFAFALWFAWTVRAALNPLLVGLLLAYILHPLVLQLERRGWSRKAAVNFIFIAFAGLVTLMVVIVFAQAKGLAEDFGSDAGSLAKLGDQFQLAVEWLLGRVKALGIDPATLGITNEEEVGRNVREQFIERARQWITSDTGAQAGLGAAGVAWAAVQGFFGSVLAVLTFVFLVPLYTWFLLFELERVSSFVGSYIPRAYREQWTRIGAAMAEMLGSFFRGRLLVCLLKGAALSLVLVILGIPYALLIGMLGGFLSLIPILGPGIGYVLALAVALLTFDPAGALWRAGVVFAVGELLEGYVLIPKILGDSLGLHPVVVLASLMIFGSALGMFGLLLALPLTAAIVILVRELVLPALRDVAEGRSTPSS